MDGIRDTKSADQLSKFLEGHIVRTTPFGANASGEKAYRRAERLVAALYILSNHVPGDEPLRNAVRAKGVALLSNIIATRDEMRNPNSEKNKEALASIREIISLMRVLGVSGSISMQNAEVIIEALDELGNFLVASQRSSLSESTAFSKDDFLAGHLAMRGRGSLRKSALLSERTPAPRISDIKDIPVSDTEAADDINRTKKDSKSSVSSRTQGQHAASVREQAILDILRSGGEFGIKDIAAHLPEYSEKMIQRELAGLVAVQRARKTGSKRWSRYSIIQ